jgi:hypothetical protein
MIYATFVYKKIKNNQLPYPELRRQFLLAGVELNTADLNKGREVCFEFHLNAQRGNTSVRSYVHLAENPLVRPINRMSSVLSKYSKWFTWDVALNYDERFVPLFLPNDISHPLFKDPASRPLFLVLVAANNALIVFDERSQLPVRLSIINWYEQNAPKDFYLFGRGWNRPAALSGNLGRIRNQFQKLVAKFLPIWKPFKTWRGPVENKHELLEKARFYIAHENCRDLPGYITEKIFDCFKAGCVPVYVGPKEIHDFIPKECFIDGRNFSNVAEMDAFLRSIGDETYRGYQKSILDFLDSPKAHQFSKEYFAETIVKTILADLALNKS